MSKNVTAVDILEEAHRLVLNGWIKGKNYDRLPHGGIGYCMAGALNEAARTLFAKSQWEFNTLYKVRTRSDAEEYLTTHAIYDEYTSTLDMVLFNDKSTTTLEDVSNLFVDAIEDARADESR